MKTKTFKTHNIAIFAVYILGSACFLLPDKNSGEHTLLALLFTFVFSGILYLAVSLFAEKLYLKNKMKPLKILFFSIAGLLSLYILCYSAYDFLIFLKKVILPVSPLWFSAILLILIFIYFLKKRQEDILKFFLLAFVFCIIGLLFFIIALSFNFDFKNLYINSLPDFKKLYNESVGYMIKIALPVIILPLYNLFTFKTARTKNGIIGVLIGFFLLGVSIILPILVFGTKLSGEYSFPLSKAVSILSVGRLFTRIDGIFYFICFLSSLCKISVSAFVLRNSLKDINRLLK